MTQLTLTTPSLLFSAISLILLAYTNRFLSYASIVRQLKDSYDANPNDDPTTLAQIDNLVTRLKLIRAMQIFGAASLLFSTAAMFFIYIEWQLLADIIFGIGMILLAISLCVCIWEIQISVEALSLRLTSLKEAKKAKKEGAVKKIFKKKRRRKTRSERPNEAKEQQHKKDETGLKATN